MSDFDTSTKKQDKSYFFTNELKPCRENSLLYDDFAPNADSDDYNLYESVRQNGILNPLHISRDCYIISGHRRHQAALWNRLETVPCLVIDCNYSELSHDERIELLAAHNSQREKSNSEKLREELLKIKPDQAYQRLLVDREIKRQRKIKNNINMGAVRKRAKITTMAFLKAAQRAINSEKDYHPMTVRRIHYLLLNAPPLRHDKKPDSVYRNDIHSYKALTSLLLRARLTGDIAHSAVEDATRPIRELAVFQSPADFIASEMEGCLRHYRRDYLRGQKNHVEILVEKNAIRKQVEFVADAYGVPVTTGRGYSSLTPRLRMVERFQASGKERLVLLILSDFDPDGEEIAASFPRSLRDDFGLRNVISRKVLLSGDDVRQYNLPSDMEAKESSPNYKKFIAKYGTHVAELDAAPIELLQRRLHEAIQSALDMNLFNSEVESEKSDAQFIEGQRRLILKCLAVGGIND